MSRREVAIANAVKIAEFIGNLIDTGQWDGYDSSVLSRKYGINWLAGGCYSKVFTHAGAPGLVIKLTLSPNEANITYLAWARAHPGPHVPVVHHLARHAKCQVAVLDRLEELDEYNRAYCAANIYDQYDGDYDITLGGVVAVAQQVYDFFKGICGWDLHTGNFMQDEEGNIIITDPITTTNDANSRTLCSGIEKAYGITAKAA